MAVFSMAGSNPALPTYPLQRSVRLRSSASAYFNRTFGTPTSNTTWTLSLWVKRGALSTAQSIISAGTSEIGYSVTTDTLKFFAAGPVLVATSTPVYRDPSAWGHWVIVSNGTTVVAYYNNVSVLSYTGTLPQLNSAISHSIGRYAGGGDQFDGYLEEINFIDGQALTPSSFGAYNSYGVWSPAKYTGSYGTNGFYLNFQDNSAVTTTANIGIGADSSGNGNYWTSNNISLTAGTTYDSMLDVPTNTSPTNANYPTLSPIDTGGGSVTLSGGNLNYSIASSTGSQVRGTMGTDLTSKWYFEYTAGSAASPSNPQIFGLSTTEGQITNNSTSLRKAVSAYSDGSTNRNILYYLNGTLTSNYQIALTSVAIGDILQIAYDAATGKVWFGKNNSWLDASNGTTGNPSAGTNQTVTIATGDSMTPFLANLGATYSGSLNCGQRPFTYTPPTGFNRLNTYNLPDSIVPVGAQYMAATTYTGNGSTQSITNTVNGTSLQPDFVWVKNRNNTAGHSLFDSVRGVSGSSAPFLQSQSTGVENNFNGTIGDRTLTSLNSNGFTLGADALGLTVNGSGRTYVGWQWRASNASAVTNTAGTITSSVSANQTAGFSIVTYTGTGVNATVGHGLNVAPKMIIMKARSTAGQNWIVYQASMDATPQNYVMGLNLTVAKSLDSTMLNNTAPTSSVWTIGTNTSVNNSGTTYVAYCFAAVPGYSAFGSYTGNGSTDGPFVYLGFRPRWIMFKQTNAAANWYIFDTSRDLYNVEQSALYPNLSNAEATSASYYMDYLSNGFKQRNTFAEFNASGGTYIYAAFAENPFKNALAR
jgi:hypothetical protein